MYVCVCVCVCLCVCVCVSVSVFKFTSVFFINLFMFLKYFKCDLTLAYLPQNPLDRDLNVSRNVTLEEVERLRTEITHARFMMEVSGGGGSSSSNSNSSSSSSSSSSNDI